MFLSDQQFDTFECSNYGWCSLLALKSSRYFF